VTPRRSDWPIPAVRCRTSQLDVVPLSTPGRGRHVRVRRPEFAFCTARGNAFCAFGAFERVGQKWVSRDMIATRYGLFGHLLLT
jgi:hypothetical protein